MTPRVFYEDESVVLWHGDSRDVLPNLTGGGLVVTDPPYSVSVAGSSHSGRPGKGSRRLDFFTGDTDWRATTRMAVDVLRLSLEACAPLSSLYAWVGHRQIGPVVRMVERGGRSSRLLGWVKACPAPPPPGAGWPSALEVCVYAYPAGRTWTHSAQNAPRSNVFTADSFRHGQPGKVDHPTQKPECVIRPLVLASSNPGDVVIDPFSGSGTTLVVAKAEGRRAIGIEREERYCAVAAARLRQAVMFA